MHTTPPCLITCRNRGFSLIQVSVMLAVAGIILVSVLPGGTENSEAEKARITLQRMQAIEEATRNFMARSQRRPCPALGSLNSTNAAFGVEHGNPNDCGSSAATIDFKNTLSMTTTTNTSTVVNGITDTSTLAPFYVVSGSGITAGTRIAKIDSTSQVTVDTAASNSTTAARSFYNSVAGVVPTTSLGLTSEYMFDGWGRRFHYAVDIRATGTNSCRQMQDTNVNGNIKIKETVTDTPVREYVMWALLSYGKDGHGARPMQGGSSRMNQGNTDDDTETNAFVDTGGTFTDTFTGTLIRKAPTTGFDDIVWTNEATKNTCAFGKKSSNGLLLKGTGNQALNSTTGVTTAVGDVNGDGIKDLAIGINGITSATAGRTYVLLGSKAGWPLTYSSSTGFSLSGLSSTTNPAGFTITNNSSISNFAKTLVLGDLNGDGYDEIIVGGSGAGAVPSISIIFGQSSFSGYTASNINTSGLTGTIATGFVISTANLVANPPPLAIGDVNCDGYKDLIYGAGGATSNNVWVVFGHNTATLLAELQVTGPPKALDLSTVTYDVGTAGANNIAFRIRSATATNTPIGNILYTIATGNLNNDFSGNYACDDIVLGAPAGSAGHNMVYVIPGHTTWIDTTSAAFALQTLTGDYWRLDLSAEFLTATTSNVWSSIAAVVPNSLWTTPRAMRFAVDTASPNALTIGTQVAVADMNNDGVKDLIIGAPTCTGASCTSKIFIQYGKSSGYPTNFTTAYVGTANGTSYNVVLSTTSNKPAWVSATMPTTLQVADMNGDGLNDLILGTASDGDGSGRPNAGTTFVLFQPSTGWATANMFGATNAAFFDTSGNPWSTSKGFRIDGYFSGIGNYAYIPAIGDFNFDGRSDIAIGAMGYVGSGSNANPNGAVYILNGRSTIPWSSTYEDLGELN